MRTVKDLKRLLNLMPDDAVVFVEAGGLCQLYSAEVKSKKEQSSVVLHLTGPVAYRNEAAAGLNFQPDNLELR